jgi:hypothetical protein
VSPRPRARGQHTGPCRYCHHDVLWLTNTTTGKVAPIDPTPVPGGNIAIDRNTDGSLVGTYSVLAGVDRDAADPTVEDYDAQPTLRLMHRLTCTSLPAAMRGLRPPDDVDDLPVEDPPEGWEDAV